MLNEIAPGVWEYQRHLRMGGVIPFPRRTTLIRMPCGGLWVHNVNALDAPGAREAVDALGPVRQIVAPNKFHHFWVDRWKETYPEAQVHAAPGLRAKKPALPVDADLSADPPPSWGDDFELMHTDGHPALREVVFFHRPSKSLIVTDWVFNVGAHEPWITRTLFRLNGCYERLRPSRIFRALAKDRTAIRASTAAICERWDFERIVMAHGQVTPGGPDALRAAFADF